MPDDDKTKALKKQLADLLKRARTGDLPWVHNLVLEAGYSPGLEALAGYVSREEVATALGVSTTAVDKWRSLGCPSIKQGRKVRLKLSEVVEWRRERDRKVVEEQVAPKGPGMLGRDDPMVQTLMAAGKLTEEDLEDPYLQQAAENGDFYGALTKKRHAEKLALFNEQTRSHLVKKADVNATWDVVAMRLQAFFETLEKAVCSTCRDVAKREIDRTIDGIDGRS